MSASDNKAIVRRYFEEGLNQKNRAVLDELLADETLRQLVTSTQANPFPDLHRTVEDLIAEGDKVVARQTNRGTHLGDYMGIPATGKRVTFTAIAILRIADGKIVEHWINRDDLGILQQIGGLPSQTQT